MDDYQKIGDKETETPADAGEKKEEKKPDAAEKKDEGKKVEEQKPDSQKVDDEIAQKQKQLGQLEESVKDETEKVRALREERRGFGDKPDTEIDDEPAENVKENAFKIFSGYHTEYRPENDPGNKRYNELERHFKRLKPGVTVAEVVETLEYVHKTYLKKEEKKPEEKKPGIGDTDSVPAQTKKDSALTRSLNKHEQAAAQHFPGGEQAYRKKLAEREEKRNK